MADRSISVILRAQVDDFTREMGKASKSLDELVKREDKHGTVAQSVAGKLVQSARLQGEMWTTVGTSLAGAGAGITAMNVAVAKTGIEYNTLQQTSRAALTAILGGSKQANAQMDKLDAFARTSPFSKSVFISAQQQMLGFGIEARKVVPYLSAINEAVAATGGSNQDIAELTRIFSQVRAASKITATDLMQFGQRGVDAATLIGSQMGKTGAQIRDEITAGTLDANVALDALAAGMQQRFEGASAGVKNTMSGAIDRVKAAWRDLSSSLMEGAVGKEGGGWLVGMTNGVADLLRTLERAPQPVKDFAFGLSAISGAGLLAAGGMMAILPRAVETLAAFRDLRKFASELGISLKGIDWKASAADIGKVGAAAGVAAAILAGLSAAFAVQNAEMDKLAPSAERVRGALLDLASGGGGASLAETFRTSAGYADNLGEALGFLERNYSSNADALSQFGASMMDFWGGIIPGARSGSEVVVESLGRIDAELAGLSTEQAVAAWQAMDKQWGLAKYSADTLIMAFPQYADAIQQMANETGAGVLSAEELAAAMGGKLPPAMQAATSALDAQATAAQAAMAALHDLANAQLVLSGSQIGVERAAMDATKAIAGNNKVLQDATATTEQKREAELSSMEALNKLAAASLAQRDAQVKANASSAQMDAAMAKNRANFVANARQMGMTAAEAELLADSYGLIPGNVSTTVTAPGATASAAQVQDLQEKIRGLPAEKRSQIAGIFTVQGYSAALSAYNSIKPKTVTVSTVFRNVGAPMRAVADGGIFAATSAGLMQQYADGGFHSTIGAQQPQIRPAGGAGILWAEDGAGPWEAFISGHPAKRQRSRWLLEETARRLGGFVNWATAYADGGIRYAPNYSPPAYAPSPSSRAAVLAGPIDLSAASVQAIAGAVLAGADKVSRAHVGNDHRAQALTGGWL